jgi:hypothetical protein
MHFVTQRADVMLHEVPRDRGGGVSIKDEVVGIVGLNTCAHHEGLGRRVHSRRRLDTRAVRLPRHLHVYVAPEPGRGLWGLGFGVWGWRLEVGGWRLEVGVWGLGESQGLVSRLSGLGFTRERRVCGRMV